jgi:hypothetical protein
MKRLGFLLAVMLLHALLPASASGQVNVNINVGSPPPVVLHAAPRMIFLPEPGVHVLVGAPYDIYFIDKRYYYYHDTHWFWASGYDGPWVVVQRLPPGLAKHKIVKLREFRDVEYVKVKNHGNGGPRGRGRNR